MANVYADMFDALSASGYPVYQEDAAPAADFTDTYLTYKVIYDEALLYAKNQPIGASTRVMVKLYSCDPEVTQGGKETLNTLCAGMMRLGGGDLPYNAPTGHYGYTCDYRYFDYEED